MIIYETLKNCDKTQIDWAHTPSGRGQGTCEGPLAMAADPWGGFLNGICGHINNLLGVSPLGMALPRSCLVSSSVYVGVTCTLQRNTDMENFAFNQDYHCYSPHLSAVLMLWPIRAWPSLWPCRQGMWLGCGPKDTSLALRSAARLVCQLWSPFTLACWHGLHTLSQAFWPLFTLVWLQLTEIYLTREKRRHTQPNLISVIKAKIGNGLISYSPVIGSAVWEFADRYSKHPETDIAIATAPYLYHSLIGPNILNRMTAFT